MFLGLRSTIYPSADLAADKAFWRNALGIEPYFDQPFYVGFNVGGYELGLDPDTGDTSFGPVAYWGTSNIAATVAELTTKGAQLQGEVAEVGDGIKMARLKTTTGTVFGVIENPHFKTDL